MMHIFVCCVHHTQGSLGALYDVFYRNIEDATFTDNGYRRGPSHQQMLTMISVATTHIDVKANILKAFRCTGVAANGEEVPYTELNSSLKAFLEKCQSKIGKETISMQCDQFDPWDDDTQDGL